MKKTKMWIALMPENIFDFEMYWKIKNIEINAIWYVYSGTEILGSPDITLANARIEKSTPRVEMLINLNIFSSNYEIHVCCDKNFLVVHLSLQYV